MKFQLGTRQGGFSYGLSLDPKLYPARAYINHVAPYEEYAMVELNYLEKLWIIGSPNSGKSNFLGRFADGCIANGDGVIVLDPKGKLARDIAMNTRFADRLIYVAPGAYQGRTFTLNIMEVDRTSPVLYDLIEIVFSNVLSLFEHLGLLDPSIMRLVEQYLDAAVQLVYALPQPTLHDVAMLFIDPGFRKELKERTRHPEFKLFWEYFEGWSDRDQRIQVDSTLGRLWPFITRGKMSFFVSNPTSTLRLADWLNQGRLIVIDLQSKLSPRVGRAIGNLIVAYLTTLYSMREQGVYTGDMSRRWRILIDEFADITPEPVARIIDNGRSFNFFPTVAHQDLGQFKKLGHNSGIPGALGHCPVLSFRRSVGDTPENPQEREQFLLEQRSLGPFDAVWRPTGFPDTTPDIIHMDRWVPAGKVGQLVVALEQAKRYTLPKSAVPSARERLDAWQQRVTMRDNEKPKRNGKPNRGQERALTAGEVPQPGAEEVPDGADSTWAGGIAPTRPTGPLDSSPSQQDVLLGRDEPGGERVGHPPRPSHYQPAVPEKAQKQRTRGSHTRGRKA